MNEIDWASELTRAALPQAVLALLKSGRRHGYAMIEVLRDHGFERLKGGTLYPLLRRLEEQGLVAHQWEQQDAGPGRKVFALTPLGTKELERGHLAWSHMTEKLAVLRTLRKAAS
ncbi:MAG: PadR family transcriptional regulator [Micrococcaceae bacterium]|nr:PadR family transcriptional regulator [Micrococcaceae bacterium]